MTENAQIPPYIDVMTVHGEPFLWPCSQCGLDSPFLVVVGQTPDYESNTASICPQCLAHAVAVLQDFVKPHG